MAASDFSRQSARNGGVAAALRQGITSLSGKLRAWNDLRATRRALSKLTDRELADIGLTRADIETLEQGDPIR